VIETLKEKQEVLNVHEQSFYSSHSRIERNKLYNLFISITFYCIVSIAISSKVVTTH